jgi:hypothetical protein
MACILKSVKFVYVADAESPERCVVTAQGKVVPEIFIRVHKNGGVECVVQSPLAQPHASFGGDWPREAPRWLHELARTVRWSWAISWIGHWCICQGFAVKRVFSPQELGWMTAHACLSVAKLIDAVGNEYAIMFLILLFVLFICISGAGIAYLFSSRQTFRSPFRSEHKADV